jgi:hypothetical protein
MFITAAQELAGKVIEEAVLTVANLVKAQAAAAAQPDADKTYPLIIMEAAALAVQDYGLLLKTLLINMREEAVVGVMALVPQVSLDLAEEEEEALAVSAAELEYLPLEVLVLQIPVAEVVVVTEIITELMVDQV